LIIKLRGKNLPRHAMHIGAVASAVSWIELACTRVVLLAHWASDVIVGVGAGLLLERMLRPMSRRLFGVSHVPAGCPRGRHESMG
jgi:hypothetical protein